MIQTEDQQKSGNL